MLQSTISVQKLVEEAVAMNMQAVAITDIGNLMGAFHFVKAVNQHNKSIEEGEGKPIKPIIHSPISAPTKTTSPRRLSVNI